MTPYRDRLKKGHYQDGKQPDQPDLDPDNLPSRHAALDELATARGVIWTADNLSITDKQDQIRAALNA